MGMMQDGYFGTMGLWHWAAGLLVVLAGAALIKYVFFR